MQKLYLILKLLTIIIIPGLLFLNTLWGNFVLDKLFGLNKFDGVIETLSSHDKYGTPADIKSDEKIFSDLLGLIEKNYPSIIQFNRANKEKILNIRAYASTPITDYGPKNGKLLFAPPTTRVAINYDPRIIDPKILGLSSIPNDATSFSYPIGTIQDIKNWINNYKSTRENSVSYGLSLVSIIAGTILNFNPFSKRKYS